MSDGHPLVVPMNPRLPRTPKCIKDEPARNKWLAALDATALEALEAHLAKEKETPVAFATAIRRPRRCLPGLPGFRGEVLQCRDRKHAGGHAYFRECMKIEAFDRSQAGETARRPKNPTH